MMISQNPSYVCGPLTELDLIVKESAKKLYVMIADVCEEVLGVRGFVPHEHCDPVAAAHLTPEEVDRIERNQVCNHTSLLVVCPIAPSWGGGIEVEMAHQSAVPVVLLCEKGRKVSRLLRGNPAVRVILEYETHDEAIARLKEWMRTYFMLAGVA